ncbi:MAG: hypothetical protein JO309_13260 [Pseudonocardiales bacterium]|nr:hypothetical protein [Pseudonocardiales bacterium]MBV9730345.1 hypothetical protein [Pseudonocardiales bacterium]
MTFPTPSSALLQAWAAVPPVSRALMELFLDAPAVVVEDLGALVAGRAGVRPPDAPGRKPRSGGRPRRRRGDHPRVRHPDCRLTAEPGPLRAIDPDVQIEELPAS